MTTKPRPASAQSPRSPASLLDGQLAASVRDSAQQIWLAGMGAFAKAQAEGSKVFDALVSEGVSLQRKTQTVASERLGEVAGRVSSMASEVGSRAGASWDKLENIFEDRTAKALAKLGVPTAQELADLQRRLEELTASVARLEQASAPGAPAAPAKRAAPRKKAAAAKTAGKTTVSTAGQPAAKAAAKTPARKAARKPAGD